MKYLSPSPYPQCHQRKTWYGLTETVILESDYLSFIV